MDHNFKMDLVGQIDTCFLKILFLLSFGKIEIHNLLVVFATTSKL